MLNFFFLSTMRKALQKLQATIPFRNSIVIHAQSQPLHSLISKCESIKDYQTIIIHQGDVSRYDLDNAWLHYIANDCRNFVLATLGYQNKKVLDNYWIVSFPIYYFVRFQVKPMTLKSNVPYGWSCLNHRLSLSRLMLGYRLWQQKQLDHMLFTQSIDVVSPFADEFLADFSDIEQYQSLLPIVIEPKWTFNNNFGTDHPAFHLAFGNVVTESETEDFQWGDLAKPLEVVTEKTFKPFHACQIPMFLAPQKHVQYVTELGYECMTDILPKDFDCMNTFDKINAIVKVVCMGRDYIADYYSAHHREIAHNDQLFHSDKVDQLIFQRIQNLFD